MKTKFKQLLSLLLTLAILLQTAPLEVFATNSNTTLPTTEDGTVIEGDGRVEDPYILGEIEEERDKYEKRFRLTDGSFSVAQFEVPVHYEEDGEWVEIDNTLQPVSMFNGTEIYQASNGDRIQAFSSTLADGTVMSIADGDAGITMSLWDGGIVEEPIKEIASEEELVSEEETPVTEAGLETEEASVVEEPSVEESALPEEEASIEEPAEEKTTSSEISAVAEPTEPEPSEEPAPSEEPKNLTEEKPAVSEAPEKATVVEEPSPSAELEIEEELSAEPVLPAYNREATAQILGNGAVALMAAEGEKEELRRMTDVMPDTISSTVLYEDVYPNVDLQYDTFSYNVKESIILNAPASASGELSASRVNPYTYTFYLELDGLAPEMQSDGSILFYDDSDAVQYTIPAPYMFDSAGNYSWDVYYSLAAEGSGYLLTVLADKTWLEDEERVYPVTIDPTLLSKESSGNFLGTTSVENGSASIVPSGQMGVGSDATYGELRMYFKVRELPEIDDGCTVVDATIGLSNASFWLVNSTSILSIHKVKSALSDTEWSAGATWQSEPNFNPAMDYATVTYSSSYGFVTNPSTWNITHATKEWYEDPSTNYGLVMTSDQGSATTNNWIYYNTSTATLILQYRNTTGLEDYYTYESHAIGRAGTVYVGDYSGNLTVVKDLVNFSNTALPYSLSLVYNSGYCSNYISNGLQDGLYAPDYSKMKIGYGWQLSAMESCKLTTIGTQKYVAYRDGDGTQHFFPGNGYIFNDEDGLGLTITAGTYGSDLAYTMTDQSGNTKYFRNGYLMYIMDGSGNMVCFLYNGASYSPTLSDWYPPATGAYLSSIVSVNNGQSTGTPIATIAYSSNLLSSITDYAGRTYTFGYSNGLIGRISEPDGSNMQYRYSGGKITTVYDAETQHGLALSHNNSGVSYITDFTATTCGGTRTVRQRIMRVKNGISETVYTYANDSGAFDADGALDVHYAFDYSGKTINATTMDYSGNILGVSNAAYTESSGTSATNNRMEKTAQSGKAAVNLLTAGGLEAHDNYSGAASAWVWTKSLSATTYYNGLIKTGELARTGDSAIKLYVSASAPVDANNLRQMGMYQSVYLTSGNTYTFSAYVNTNQITGFGTDGGVYAAIQNSDGSTTLAKGVKVDWATNENLADGWQRVYVTYACTSSGNYRAAIIQENAYGVSFIDDLQLELGDVPSSTNLLQNGSFLTSLEWTMGDFTRSSGTAPHAYTAQATGSPTTTRRASQTVNISGSMTDTYILSGWAKAISASGTKASLDMEYDEANTQRYFGLIAKCIYKNASGGVYSEYFYLPFNDDYQDWQYASCAIVPNAYAQSQNWTFDEIKVMAVYDYNINTVQFDSISLRKEPCTTYTYDAYGNMASVNSTGTSTNSYSYENGTTKLMASTSNATGTTAYYYGDTRNSHLVTQITNNNVATVYTYDAVGNVTQTNVKNTAYSAYPNLISTATYSADGSQLLTQTDTSGYTTTYGYDSWHNLASVTDHKGNTVNQTYNYDNDRPDMTYMTGKISVQNAYEKGFLTEIERGGFVPNDSTKYYQTYNMAYDAFGNMTSFTIGSRTLASYAYSNYKNLQSVSYRNGDTISYTYDDLDRVTNITSNDGQNVQNYYNSEGNLSKVLDNASGDGIHYDYDSLGRLIYSYRTTNNNSGNPTIIQRTEHIYDTDNRISSQSWEMGSKSYTEDYTYNGDGTLGTFKLTRNGTVLGTNTFAYDSLRRLSTRTNGLYEQKFTYRDINSSRTTNQIKRLSYTEVNSTDNLSNFNIEYTYDDLGNIATVNSAVRTVLNASYGYNELGQLTSETNNNGTYTYTYDTYGNIRSVSGAESHTYTYTDDKGWADLLKSFDGTAIYYDGIENPTNWKNATTWTNLTWVNGRQLSQIKSSDKTVDFTYDALGVRNSKTVTTSAGTVKYDYLTLNGQVVQQTWKGTDNVSHVMEFIYDNQGRPYAMIYDGTLYYYLLNQQGDVVIITSANGSTVGRYAYDAWGRVIYSNGSMCDVNPIRYRGYYYDSETGLYYLQSRYYDPLVKRFLNPDSRFDENAGFVGYNLFSYCANNPVMFRDETGEGIILTCILIGAAVGAIAGGVGGALVSKKVTGSVNGWWIAGGALLGGGVGAAAGWGVGSIAAGVSAASAAATGATSAGVVSGTIAQYEQILYNSWQSAEQGLRMSINSVSDYASRVLSTPMGSRVVDAYNKSTNVIAEAKYGYQSLSTFIKSEVARDAWLLQSGTVNEVQWHFYFSQKSHTIGASYNLIKALLDAGIQVIFH